MVFKTEIASNMSKCLFVSESKKSSVDIIRQALNKYGIEIFFSEILPKKIDHFDFIVLFVSNTLSPEIIPNLPVHKKILIICDKQKGSINKYDTELHKKTKIKLVNIDLDTINETAVDKILWFFFSKSEHHILDLQTNVTKAIIPGKLVRPFELNLKKSLIMLIALFLFIQILFIIPLGLSAIFMKFGLDDLKNNNWKSLESNVKAATGLNKAANELYYLVRPTYSFFYLALLVDDMFLIENKSLAILAECASLAENGQRFSYLFFNSQKDQDSTELKTRLNYLKRNVDFISDNLKILNEKLGNYGYFYIPDMQQNLEMTSTLLTQWNKITPHLTQILGEKSEKKYLIFFQNNMEIRPGGGFIGSYAIVKIKNFAITELKIEDVYETDGQLKIHIDPPEPIRKYLAQPHWFLRDSNFSPDFQENFKQAEFFLQKSMNSDGFDGGIAITTTAITHLLQATGPIYLPDYKETINKDNFYIKTQIQSETGFFPGSKQKKNYLSSLTNSLLARLDTMPLKNIAVAIKKSLDEKQMVMYFKYSPLQQEIERLGISGKVAALDCSKTTLTNGICIADEIMPIDANLGVNKANFFVKRLMTMKLNIKAQGLINHVFSTTFINNSSSNIYPGGPYKNYHQIYLPRKAIIKTVFLDSDQINDYEVNNINQFKIVSLLAEIPPQKTRTVRIEYDLKLPDYDGKILHQLVVQKQIGALNNDFVLEYNFDEGIQLVRRNFTALAKGNSLIYNTTLSNDRIFLVEFTIKH